MKTSSATLAVVASLARKSLAQTYEPTWESTDQHNASPEWFRDAKFGVYWHWGAFTTPQYASEWYGRYVYEPNSDTRAEHTRRYGPPEEWPYGNFIVGANDLNGNHVQFQPVLSSEGGEFDPESWIALVKASGARFAGPVAEHHDGYSMWDSQVNEWNSVAYGPKMDLVKLWEGLVRGNDMKFLIAMHQAFNTNGFFQYAPQQNDTSHQKLYGQLPKDQSDQLWLDKHVEVLDHVQPDIIWNDFSLDSPGYCGEGSPCNIGEQQRLEFLAHYFNRGVEWNKEVLTTYKHFDKGFRDTSAVADFERGGPADLVRPYWLTDDAISASSWSYTVGMPLYNSVQMIHSMLDRISKNGNMLLNISPTAVGTIPDQQQQVLKDIGAFLARYTEAIHNTRAWDIYGEGPNKAGGGSFTAPLTGNSSDIRFTRNKDKNTLYASILGWPADSTVFINSLGSNAGVDVSGLKAVELLSDSAGSYTAVTGWEQGADSLEIGLPSQPSESQAYVLKLTFDSNIPVPQISGGASVFTSDSVKGRGISLPQGEFKSAFFEDEGTAVGDVTLLRVDGGASVTVYSNGDLTGDSAMYTSGEHAIAKGSFGSIKVAQA